MLDHVEKWATSSCDSRLCFTRTPTIGMGRWVGRAEDGGGGEGEFSSGEGVVLRLTAVAIGPEGVVLRLTAVAICCRKWFCCWKRRSCCSSSCASATRQRRRTSWQRRRRRRLPIRLRKLRQQRGERGSRRPRAAYLAGQCVHCRQGVRLASKEEGEHAARIGLDTLPQSELVLHYLPLLPSARAGTDALQSDATCVAEAGQETLQGREVLVTADTSCCASGRASTRSVRRARSSSAWASWGKSKSTTTLAEAVRLSSRWAGTNGWVAELDARRRRSGRAPQYNGSQRCSRRRGLGGQRLLCRTALVLEESRAEMAAQVCNDVTILTLNPSDGESALDARIQRVQVAKDTPRVLVAAHLERGGAYGRYADEETEAEEADGAAPRVGAGEVGSDGAP